MSAMTTELDALKAQIRAIEAEPDTSNGVSATSFTGAGSCLRMLVAMRSSDGTVPPKEAQKAERKACLEVQILKRHNACRCLAVGQRPSLDGASIKSAIDARAKFTFWRRKAETFGIRDPAVRQFVRDASEIEECWSAKSLQILERSSNAIEASIMADGPPSVSPVYAAPPSVSAINGGPPPISRTDGGVQYRPRGSVPDSDVSGTTQAPSSAAAPAVIGERASARRGRPRHTCRCPGTRQRRSMCRRPDTRRRSAIRRRRRGPLHRRHEPTGRAESPASNVESINEAAFHMHRPHVRPIRRVPRARRYDVLADQEELFRPRADRVLFPTRSGWTWPNNGSAFDLKTSRIETIKITCEVGEKICYGAWVAGNGSQRWGAGLGGVLACQHCCGTCGSQLDIRLEGSAEEAAVTATETAPAKQAVVAFKWVYNFQPSPGVRSWSRDDRNRWHERYPDGNEAKMFDRVGRGTVDGCAGATVRRSAEPEFEVFIPDIGCNRMWALFRRGNGSWNALGEMLAIR